jgi:crossover junction endodeoxyribonuclease RuvC
MSVIGIDIGVVGAVAVLSSEGELLKVEDMPVLRTGPMNRATVSAPLLAEIIRAAGATHAFVEYVGARPGEGAVGAFAFGRARGVIEGVCGAVGVPVTFLTPPCWKRAVGISGGDKDRSRGEAVRRWPGQANLFARVRDNGRSDAALIALAGIIQGKIVDVA